MTAERARAYAHLMALLERAEHLQPGERDQLRRGADVLLFAAAPDTETCEALSEAGALGQALADSGRCAPETAGALLAALRSCGPEGVPAWATSAGDQRFARHPAWLRARG
jgi:hypothetical protein